MKPQSLVMLSSKHAASIVSLSSTATFLHFLSVLFTHSASGFILPTRSYVTLLKSIFASFLSRQSSEGNEETDGNGDGIEDTLGNEVGPADGDEECNTDGDEVGNEDGITDGNEVGTADGDKVGNEDGITDGNAVGTADGDEVDDGNSDGDCVGSNERSWLGIVDGIEEGDFEGILNGKADGRLLGMVVGIPDGVCEGNSLSNESGTLVATLVGGSEVCLNPSRSQVRDFGSMSAFKNAIPLQATLLLLT